MCGADCIPLLRRERDARLLVLLLEVLLPPPAGPLMLVGVPSLHSGTTVSSAHCAWQSCGLTVPKDGFSLYAGFLTGPRASYRSIKGF